MSEALEKIIKDIYALDPALEADDVNVRAIVAQLSENKPVVTADPVFVSELRTKLLQASIVPVLDKKPILSPWFMYLAPLGVAAVFVLLLLPRPLSHPTTLPLPVVPSSSPKEDSVPNVTRTFEASHAKQASPEMSVTADSMPMQFDALPAATDYFSIGDQASGQVITVEYIEVSEPSFLVFQKMSNDGNMVVLGVSDVFSGGLEQLFVPIPYKMQPGEIIEAALYRDNGDGFYTPGTDYPVFEAGQDYPMLRSFVVF